MSTNGGSRRKAGCFSLSRRNGIRAFFVQSRLHAARRRTAPVVIEWSGRVALSRFSRQRNLALLQDRRAVLVGNVLLRRGESNRAGNRKQRCGKRDLDRVHVKVLKVGSLVS